MTILYIFYLFFIFLSLIYVFECNVSLFAIVVWCLFCRLGIVFIEIGIVFIERQMIYFVGIIFWERNLWKLSPNSTSKLPVHYLFPNKCYQSKFLRTYIFRRKKRINMLVDSKIDKFVLKTELRLVNSRIYSKFANRSLS